MRTAIFDLDGTLVDTSGDMLAGANAVFEALGHGSPLNVSDHAAVAFAGGRAMLEKGAEICGFSWEDRYDAAYAHFLEAYAAHLDRLSTIYPGVETCLDQLALSDWKLAVCTNKPSGLAEDLLMSLGLRDRFGAMIGADTLSVRKPNPEPLYEAVRRVGGKPDRAVLIGDTITDRNAAKNAGMPSVLVTFGPSSSMIWSVSCETFSTLLC